MASLALKNQMGARVIPSVIASDAADADTDAQWKQAFRNVWAIQQML